MPYARARRFLRGLLNEAAMDIRLRIISPVKLLLDEMVDEDSAIVSIYYGEDVSEEAAEEIAAVIEEKYPDVEVEINNGGQPIYYYVISVE